MQISIGANQFYWSRETTLAFYEQLAGGPAERIYLGETICPKRRELNTDDWLEVAAMLRNAGKEVVLSTLTLLEADSDVSQVRRVCRQNDYLIEANDMAAIQIAQELERPFVIGPAINVYSSNTLDYLLRQGGVCWVPPVEISRDQISSIMAQQTTGTELEIFAYGFLPLAYSARCYTARFHQRKKDDCERICLEHADGIPVQSQDGETVFNLNGISTQSGLITHLLPALADMREMSVDRVRLSPVSQQFGDVVQQYHSALTRELPEQIPVASGSFCNGYWYGEAGKATL